MRFKTFILFIIIFSLAVFLRLYRFAANLNMGTDQGAAYILADRIINTGHILEVGPFTSLWQVNLLPPTYYYIVTFIYFITGSQLLLPLTFFAFNIFSVYLLFLLGSEIFSVKTGLVSALLFSVSETMIWYGRDFWEPHLVPFFIISSLLFLFRAKNRQKIIFWHLSVLLFFAGFLYVSAFLLLPLMFTVSLGIYRKIRPLTKFPFVAVFLYFLFYGFLFYIPNIFFELNNGNPSFIYMISVLKGNTPYVSYNFPVFITSVSNHFSLFFASLFIYPAGFTGYLLAIILPLLYFFYFKKIKTGIYFRLISVFLASAFLLTGLYSSQPEVYRLSALYPLAFLWLGALVTAVDSAKNYLIYRLFAFYLIFAFIFLNLKSAFPDFSNLNYDKYLHPYSVAFKILSSNGNESFSIYTITPDDHDNHHSTSFWWALEKLSGIRLATLNSRGNWIEQAADLKKDNLYLICWNFENISETDLKCRDYFIREYKLDEPVEKFTVDSTRIYKFKFPKPTDNFLKKQYFDIHNKLGFLLPDLNRFQSA